MSPLFFYSGVVAPSFELLPLGMGVFRYKKMRPPHRFLFYYLIFAGVSEIVGIYTAEHRINNLWLLHIYTAVETVMLLWFYRLILQSRIIRRVIPFLMVFFPLLCLANGLWWQSMWKFNTYTRPLEALLLIFMGLAYFLENSHEPDQQEGARVPTTWMNVGLLMYFSLSFFIFIFSNYLKQGQAFNTVIVVLHATFALIMYILFTVGFYKCKRS
jgi:hypothetical protein